jgi:hypothetical protein
MISIMPTIFEQKYFIWQTLTNDINLGMKFVLWWSYRRLWCNNQIIFWKLHIPLTHLPSNIQQTEKYTPEISCNGIQYLRVIFDLMSEYIGTKQNYRKCLAEFIE